MKVIYIGMFNEQGYAGLAESSYAKRKEVVAAIASAAGGKLIDLMSVSYTHLTLPTILRV